MPTAAFSCPHCSALLRIRDRALLGRQVDCPDCDRPILIQSDGPRGFVAVADGAPSDSDATDASTRTWQAIAANPAVLGWTISVCGALGLLAVMNYTRQDEALETAAAVKDSQDVEPPHLSQRDETSVSHDGDHQADVGEPQPATVDERLPNKIANTSSLSAGVRRADDTPQGARPAGDGLAATAAESSNAISRAPVEAPTPPLLAGASGDIDITSAAASPVEPSIDQSDPLPVAINVEARLGQQIAEYHTLQPVALKTLLDEIEELVGLPIHAPDEIDLDEALETPVSVRLSATTVGGILTAILEEAGLSYSQEDDGIRIHPRPPTPDI